MLSLRKAKPREPQRAQAGGAIVLETITSIKLDLKIKRKSATNSWCAFVCFLISRLRCWRILLETLTATKAHSEQQTEIIDTLVLYVFVLFLISWFRCWRNKRRFLFCGFWFIVFLPPGPPISMLNPIRTQKQKTSFISPGPLHSWLTFPQH